MKTMVINLFGAPGAGKSTGAAFLFSMLKQKRINCELVTEFAKDLTWENNIIALNNQAYVYGNQSYKISKLNNKVDVIITDSPIFLSIYYGKDGWNKDHPTFVNTVLEDFNNYNNLNFFIYRVKDYITKGHFQKEKESDVIATDLLELLNYHNIDYYIIPGNSEGYKMILKLIMQELEKEGIINE